MYKGSRRLVQSLKYHAPARENTYMDGNPVLCLVIKCVRLPDSGGGSWIVVIESQFTSLNPLSFNGLQL